MEVNLIENNRVRLTTEVECITGSQVYFKDHAKVFALTATLIVPVFFNSFDRSIQGAATLPTKHSVQFVSSTEAFSSAVDNNVVVCSDRVSMAELTLSLFPAPIELNKQQASKHRSAISSFFKKV